MKKITTGGFNNPHARQQQNAMEVLRHYASPIIGTSKNLEDDLEGFMVDLLIDLHHLAKARGINWSEAFIKASQQFERELKGE